MFAAPMSGTAVCQLAAGVIREGGGWGRVDVGWAVLESGVKRIAASWGTLGDGWGKAAGRASPPPGGDKTGVAPGVLKLGARFLGIYEEL